MALAGSRFDPEVMRRQAEEARERAKQKKTMTMIVNIVIALVVIAVGFTAWNWWQKRSEEKARIEQEAHEAEVRQEAEQARQKAEKAKAEKAKREAEVAAREAERKRAEAERKRIRDDNEKARREAEIAREKQKREEYQAKMKEEKEKAELEARKRIVENGLAGVSFNPRDHVVVRQGIEGQLEFEVDGKAWGELQESVQKHAYVDFFELVRGKNVTNEFSVASYPDRETFALMMENLKAMTFRLVITPGASGADLDKLTIVGLDAKKGLAVPKNCHELKGASGRCGGWTVPFVFGEGPKVYILEKAALPKLCEEWTPIRRRTKKAEMDAALEDFAQVVRLELSHAMKLEEPKKETESKRETKSRTGFKGASDIRSFNRK